MGYMGLKTMVDSDTASDLASTICDDIVKRLKEELKNKEAGYNTPGCFNVGLFFAEVVCKSSEHFTIFGYEGLLEVAKETRNQLEKYIKEIKKSSVAEWQNAKAKQEHLLAYQRVRRSVLSYITKAEHSNRIAFGKVG